MNRKLSLSIISVLLTITAVIMIYLGISLGMAPPTLTGVGFLLIVWALQVVR